jgi:hypothetical protein
MKNISQIYSDRELLIKLHLLHKVPARKQSNVAKGRARYLREVRDLSLNRAQPVSNSFLTGLMVWIKNYIPIGKTRKEVNMIWMKLSTVALVIVMVFGGAVTAVQAAEASLPGQLMYPLKILVEDVQGIAASPEDQVQQSMLRLENRIQEILRLREQNKEVPESSYQKVENQLELTLRLMTGLADDELVPGLINLQSRLMVQDRLLQELQNQGQSSDDAVLERLRTMLQTRLQLLEDGIKDPQQLKIQLRDRDRDRDSRPDNGNQPANGQGSGTTDDPGLVVSTPTPGAYGLGPGPAEKTPTAGAYGPGPGPIEATITPGTFGPGPGPIENTPTPGAYGPGSGPIENTTTPGAYGPGATPTQDGFGGGNNP